MQDLGSKRDLWWEDPKWFRNMATLGMPDSPCRESVQNLWAVTAKTHGFAILRQHPVMVRVKRPACSDNGGFLAVDGCNCADAALALQAPQAITGDPGLDHLAEHAHEVFVVQS